MKPMKFRFPKNNVDSKHDLYFIQFDVFELEKISIEEQLSSDDGSDSNALLRSFSPDNVFDYSAKANKLLDTIQLPLQTTPKEETTANLNETSTKTLSRVASFLSGDGGGVEALTGFLTERAAEKISPELLNVIRGAQGKTINEQMQVIYDGPNRRTYSFEFTLVAKNYEDAVEARKIAKRLQYHASPSLSAEEQYFNYPNLVKFHFIRANENVAMENLFKSKYCYIESVNVEYGDGIYNEFVNINQQKETGIFRISISLKEAEYMLKDDFWTEDDNA